MISNLSFSLLKARIRGVADDQRESLSVLNSNLQARDEEFEDFRREFHDVALDVGAIRDKMTANEVINSNINSSSGTSLENLPKLQESIQRLPEMLEKLLQNKFERHWQKTSELLQNSRLSELQRNIAMQDHVSEALFTRSNTKLQKGPFYASEAA